MTQVGARGSTDSFSLLAGYYDSLGGNLADLSSHAFNIIRTFLAGSIHTICDLGCGTGRTAARLAADGFEVYAVDPSAAMCAAAVCNAARRGYSISVLVADAVGFVLP